MEQLAVFKFGGTSIGTGERLVHVASVILNASKVYKPIIVVSAMSSKVKAEGTTSRFNHYLSLDYWKL